MKSRVHICGLLKFTPSEVYLDPFFGHAHLPVSSLLPPLHPILPSTQSFRKHFVKGQKLTTDIIFQTFRPMSARLAASDQWEPSIHLSKSEISQWACWPGPESANQTTIIAGRVWGAGEKMRLRSSSPPIGPFNSRRALGGWIINSWGANIQRN